jgi:Arc/MetJ family transcription regulator
MRTTLDLPDDLLSEAMRLSKVRTKTGAVVLSLQELINRRKIERLRKLKGKLDLDIDLDSLRRDRTPS